MRSDEQSCEKPAHVFEFKPPEWFPQVSGFTRNRTGYSYTTGMNVERQRPWSSGHELHGARRELIKIRRRRSERILLLTIIFVPMMVYVAYQLGRSLLYMQGVLRFANNITAMPPADVKASVNRFAHDLDSSNPMIRNGAITVLKIATRWNLGSDATAWAEMWAKQEPFWEYHRPSTNAPPPSPDWRKLIPPDAKSAPPAQP